MTDLVDVFKWLAGRDTGLSSKAIASHMTCGWCDGTYPPADPADLGRCLRLLERFPEWKARMPEMAKYKDWKNLIARWDEVAQSMADEVGIDWSKGRSAPKTYDLMCSIR